MSKRVAGGSEKKVRAVRTREIPWTVYDTRAKRVARKLWG